jgi:diamine N-acetyltransferase
MTHLSFHRVNNKDLVELLEISHRTFRDAFYHLNTPDSYNAYVQKAFTGEKLLSEVENPATEFFFLKNQNIIVGYFKLNSFEAQSDIHDPHSLEIESIYVLKEFQNQKLGSYILDYIKNYARIKPYQYVWLGVWEKNTDAIRFYTKNGFKEFGSHPFLFGTELQTDILMRYDIHTTS